MFSAILRLPRLSNISVSRNISALYITGEKASETFSVLTPHIDFEERLENKQELEKNLQLRQIDINLEDVIRLWNFYKHIESKKISLEESKTSISKTIISLAKKGDKYGSKIETLKAHGKMVKEDLRVLKESFWSVEEKAAIQALAIPNVLHPHTPETENKIVHSFLEKREHTKIQDTTNFVECIEDNSNYYLKNEAARFELNSSFYLSDQLLKKRYTQFSNSDFARSVVVEGAGLDFSDPTKVFSINDVDSEHKHENSRLHLIGAASLSSFMAFHCKHSVFPSQLPLKYFTIGRKYQPVTSTERSLFNVPQETAVHVFVATKDDANSMTTEFENVLRDVIDIYESLNHHFRVCFLAAKDLHRWESLRASVQMFSPTLNDYVEVGNVSLSGNYVSKRLLFNYGKGVDLRYPGIVSGTVLSVPKMLGCLLQSDETLAPIAFKNYV